MIDFETKKVLFIDLDSTLIKTISGKTFPEDITDFRVQLPVLDKIIEKMPNLNMFFIVSNQGGLKTLTDKRIFNYKIWAVEGICHGYFINKLNNFSYSDSLYCCSMDKNDTYRKPNTGMLEQLYYQYKVESKDGCIKFCESHNSDEIYDYLKRLYSYIQVINLEYTILDIDSEKGYVEYKAIIKVNNKYYSFDYYQSPYWNFKDQADEDLTEVFPKEITTVIYV